MVLDLTAPLAYAQTVVEDLMTDACVITVDPGGVDDDVLDPVTLELTPAGQVVLYSGPCGVSARNPSGQTTQQQRDEGGHDEWAGRYTLKTPRTALDIPPGADVEITASRDPWLVGKMFRTIAPTGGTFKLSRRTEIELRQDGS